MLVCFSAHLPVRCCELLRTPKNALLLTGFQQCAQILASLSHNFRQCSQSRAVLSASGASEYSGQSCQCIICFSFPALASASELIISPIWFCMVAIGVPLTIY